MARIEFYGHNLWVWAGGKYSFYSRFLCTQVKLWRKEESVDTGGQPVVSATKPLKHLYVYMDI